MHRLKRREYSNESNSPNTQKVKKKKYERVVVQKLHLFAIFMNFYFWLQSFNAEQLIINNT